MSNKENTQIGDNNTNIQNDIVIEEDLGVIQEIFDEVLENYKESEDINEKDLIEVRKKIEINTETDQEKEQLRELIESSYDKIDLVEKAFSGLDRRDQRDIMLDIREKFNASLIDKDQNVLKTLRKLFELYSPSNKKRNPKYASITRAFVLFFFDDCTIGKKE